jgi:hypothetical protein
MWLVIVIVLSVGLGVLALIGLLAVAKEIFREDSRDANLNDPGDATDRHEFACAHGRGRVMLP